MSITSLAAWSLGAVAVAGGAVGGTAVLLTSGPLANEEDQRAPLLQEATSTPGHDQTVAPERSPSGTPGVQSQLYAPDETLLGSTPVDLERLPAVDDQSWVSFVGPNGSLSLRMPPGWDLHAAPVRDFDGNIVPGDTITIRKRPAEEGPVEFGHLPGWVKLDAATTPFKVPIESGGETLRETTLVSAGDRTLRALQYAPDPARADPYARMLFTLEDCSPSAGLCVSLIATIDFDMTVADLATLLSVVESVEVR